MIHFSHIEKRDLLKAWVLSSLAFALALAGINASLLIAIPVALVTAGIGIILHEISHKLVAARFGIHSEFRSADKMLWISVVIAAFGFLFLAPGAVYFTSQEHDPRKHGLIALAGPMMNIIIALFFLPLTIPLGGIASYGYMINAWLGMFNMIPFWGLDGEKVIAWKPLIFWPVMICAAFMVFFGYYAL
jgi:Zn-dependent protease